MPNQPISFTSPAYDYSADVSSIERRRRMAEMLQQQGMQQIPEQPVGQGQFAVRTSPFQMAAKLAQVAAGSHQQSKADEQQRALAQTAQNDLAQVLQSAQRASAGTPATPLSEDASSNVTPAQPAVPGNIGEAASIYMRHPMTAPLGMQMMQQDQAQQSRQRAMAEFMKPDNQSGQSPAYGSPGFAPQGQPQQGSPLSGLPPKVVAMMTSGDPEISKLGATLAENYKMQNVRPGGTVYQPGVGPVFTAPQNGMQTTWGQGGPQSAVVPGAQEGAARGAGLTSGAQEAAKFPYREVESGAGRKVPAFTIPSLMQAMATAPGGPQAGQASPQAAPQAQPPQVPQPVQRPLQPSPMAPRQLPTADPWKSIPRLEEPGGVGQSTYQNVRQKQAGELASKIAEENGKLADTANMRKTFNDEALALLNKSTTGAGALGITEVQNFLTQRLGLPESLLKAASNGDPTATLELNKNLVNAATQGAKAIYGPRLAQSEVKIQLEQAAPNIGMTKAAILMLVKMDNARSDYQIQKTNALGQYLQKQGDPYQFEGWYAKNFPMSDATSQTRRQSDQPTVQPIYIVNQTTKERRVSNDGGKSWQTAR